MESYMKKNKSFRASIHGDFPWAYRLSTWCSQQFWCTVAAGTLCISMREKTVQGDCLFQGILHLFAFELLINSSGDEKGEVCCMQLEASRECMLTPAAWSINSGRISWQTEKVFPHTHGSGQIITTKPLVGHRKLWFSKGIPPKSP